MNNIISSIIIWCEVMVKTCKGKTIKGHKCGRRVKKENMYCHQHKKQEIFAVGNSCPICLEKDNTMFVLSCSHHIHLECSEGLTSPKCPLCRAFVTNWPEELKEKIEKNQEMRKMEIAEQENAEMIESMSTNIVFVIPGYEDYEEDPNRISMERCTSICRILLFHDRGRTSETSRYGRN